MTAFTFIDRSNCSPVMYVLDKLARWSKIVQHDAKFEGPRVPCPSDEVPDAVRVAGRAALLASIRAALP